MVSLQLTGVCLPTKVLAVDEGDSLISLGASLVLSMGVNAVRWGALGLMGLYLFSSVGLELNVVRFGWRRRLVLSWLGHNLVLRCDHCYFHCVGLGFDTDRLLHVIVSLLFSIEARNRMSC
jgi:hypothetical protein